jgi:hypothetical protein
MQNNKMLKYIVTNLKTGNARIFLSAEDVINSINFGDDDISPEMVSTLFGENAMTEVEDVNEVRYRIELKQDPSPPGGEGGRRKKSSQKKKMRTRKHGGKRRMKTVKHVVGKYTEAPRSRSVFQMEGGRKRRSHRRL